MQYYKHNGYSRAVDNIRLSDVKFDVSWLVE
jgi:hypothetical protein